MQAELKGIPLWKISNLSKQWRFWLEKVDPLLYLATVRVNLFIFVDIMEQFHKHKILPVFYFLLSFFSSTNASLCKSWKQVHINK